MKDMKYRQDKLGKIPTGTTRTLLIHHNPTKPPAQNRSSGHQGHFIPSSIYVSEEPSYFIYRLPPQIAQLRLYLI